MAEPATYTALDSSFYPDGLSVRWHNKLSRAGNEQGGFSTDIIEGIERLVFSQDELDALGLVLERGGIVDVPGYGLRFVLDTSEPADGPVNVYWVVTQS